MSQNNAGFIRTIGKCDKCQRDIHIQKGTNLLMLKATNYKWDLETFYVEYTLCEACRRSFESWIAKNS